MSGSFGSGNRNWRELIFFFFLHKRRIKVGILDKMKEERRVKETEGRAVCNVTSQILSQAHFMLRCSMGAILGMGSYGRLWGLLCSSVGQKLPTRSSIGKLRRTQLVDRMSCGELGALTGHGIHEH